MKIPNWMKIAWWLGLFLAVSVFLYGRLPSIHSGQPTAFDALAFIVWMALALAPVFQEINIFGVRVRQEITSLKEDVRQQISSLQTEIRTSIRTEVNPQINFPYPPPDSQLPAIEDRIRSIVQDAMRDYGTAPSKEAMPPEVTDDVQYLFAVRLNLEKELRRVFESRLGQQLENRPIPLARMIGSLVETDIVEPRLAHAVREVYSVCSPAIHGSDVTAAQVAFVKDVAPGLVSALRTIV